MASRQAAAQCAEWAMYQRALHIAAYRAVSGELDPQELMRLAVEQDKRVYLPVLEHGGEPRLKFRRWTPDCTMRPNRLGIPEPVAMPDVGTGELDLVLMPLTAVDARGNRLGQGAGYYDRTFAFLKDKPATAPVLAGFAYDFQIVDGIEPQPWDVPLRFIVTPSGVVECRE